MSGFFYANNSLISDRIESRNSLAWAYQSVESTLVDEQTKQTVSVAVLRAKPSFTSLNKAVFELLLRLLVRDLSRVEHFTTLHIHSSEQVVFSPFFKTRFLSDLYNSHWKIPHCDVGLQTWN